MTSGQDSGEGKRQAAGADPEPSGVEKRIHWTEIRLHFADDSDLTSSWDAARARAVQRGGRGNMDEDEATQEHLRALAELRHTGGTTNWYTNEACNPTDNLRPEEIDWRGFIEPERS